MLYCEESKGCAQVHSTPVLSNQAASYRQRSHTTRARAERSSVCSLWVHGQKGPVSKVIKDKRLSVTGHKDWRFPPFKKRHAANEVCLCFCFIVCISID